MSKQMNKDIKPPDQEKFESAIQELSVLENLTYCVRDEKDILIHEKTWYVCRVDFSEAFAPEMDLIQDSEITRCSRKLYRGLLDLEGGETRIRLGSHLNEEEMNALLKRKDLILEKLNTLIKERGEDKVLFD